MSTAPPNSESWLRLKVFLSDLRPGDAVTAADAINQTDLEPESVDVVLGALTRARLFEQCGEYFVRCQIDVERGP